MIGKRSLLLLIAIVCLCCGACGKRNLRADEIERNRLFSEILKRTDHRAIGDDGFFVRHLAASADPEVQAWCATALGRIGSPRALPMLYNALHSPLAAVRAAAAFSVGVIEDRDLLAEEFIPLDPRATAELTAMLYDSAPAVQMRAVEALGKAGKQTEASAILKRVESFQYHGDPIERSWLELAITALIRLKDPAANAVMERLARSDDLEIQWRSENALIRLEDREACPTFRRLLESKDPGVRAYAARGIGVCGDMSLAETLHPLLSPDGSSSGEITPLQVRVCALHSLADLKNPASVTAIIRALDAAPMDDAHPDQVNFAIQAASVLGSLGEAFRTHSGANASQKAAAHSAYEAQSALERLLHIPGPIAASAAVALAEVLKENPDRFFAVADISRFTTPSAARAWAAAVGELGGPRAVEELKRMLRRALAESATSSEMLAVPAILRALSTTGTPDLNEILEPFLASHDGVVLRAAAAAYKPKPGIAGPWHIFAQAYAGSAGSADVETKVALLKKLEPWVTDETVKALLREALGNRDRNVRIAAARLLRMAGETSVPDDPGPVETATTDFTFDMVAASRNNRTVAILETQRGNIEIELFREDAPLTVSNFVTLARRGFYDGSIFTRVVPFFVIQGGDPRNDQEGGPGYSIRCENNLRPFTRGSIGMALSGRDTAGSQFFITLSPQPHLDSRFTCFGRVISGMQAADHIVPGEHIRKVVITEDVTSLDSHRF